MKDAFVEIMNSGVSNEELGQGWLAIEKADKEAIWHYMSFDEKLKFYEAAAPRKDRPWLFQSLPLGQDRFFFVKLSSERQFDTYSEADMDGKWSIFLQLRFIDESKPIELIWNKISMDGRKMLYDYVNKDMKQWIKDHLTEDQWKEFENYDPGDGKG